MRATKSVKTIRIPKTKIRNAYREYYQQQFGTFQELLDTYGFALYDKIMAEENKKNKR
jgi:hypothetical protein